MSTKFRSVYGIVIRMLICFYSAYSIYSLLDYSYIHRTSKTKSLYVFGILSKTENYELRQLHRKSLIHVPHPADWPINIRFRFLIDRPTKETIYEALTYGDVFFLNATRSGYAVRYAEKVFRWFKYAASSFPQSRLIGKMDDDVYLCVHQMFERLWNIEHGRLYYGLEHSFIRMSPLLNKFGGKIFHFIEHRRDGHFVVLGRELIDRILKRRFCNADDDTVSCNPFVDLIGTNFGGESIGIWLSIYDDVVSANDNSRFADLLGYPESMIRTNFCDDHLLLHHLRNPEDMARMYSLAHLGSARGVEIYRSKGTKGAVYLINIVAVVACFLFCSRLASVHVLRALIGLGRYVSRHVPVHLYSGVTRQRRLRYSYRHYKESIIVQRYTDY